MIPQKGGQSIVAGHLFLFYFRFQGRWFCPDFANLQMGERAVHRTLLLCVVPRPALACLGIAFRGRWSQVRVNEVWQRAGIRLSLRLVACLCW